MEEMRSEENSEGEEDREIDTFYDEAFDHGPLSSQNPCHLFLLISGNMIPISRIVNSSQVSFDSNLSLSSNSILIKWRLTSSPLSQIVEQDRLLR